MIKDETDLNKVFAMQFARRSADEPHHEAYPWLMCTATSKVVH
jgi:hypothetical protein